MICIVRLPESVEVLSCLKTPLIHLLASISGDTKRPLQQIRSRRVHGPVSVCRSCDSSLRMAAEDNGLLEMQFLHIHKSSAARSSQDNACTVRVSCQQELYMRYSCDISRRVWKGARILHLFTHYEAAYFTDGSQLLHQHDVMMKIL